MSRRARVPRDLLHRSLRCVDALLAIRGIHTHHIRVLRLGDFIDAHVEIFGQRHIVLRLI